MKLRRVNVVVRLCKDCPYISFENSNRGGCAHPDIPKKIWAKSVAVELYSIPSWCPLPIVEEKKENT